MERPSETSRMNERYSTQVETIVAVCVISIAPPNNKEKASHFSLSLFGALFLSKAVVSFISFAIFASPDHVRALLAAIFSVFHSLFFYLFTFTIAIH